MGTVFAELPPPGDWQDFERITLDIARKVWKDDYADRHGRSGQNQRGVDVFGYNYNMNEESGVQCKKRKRKLAGVEAPGHSLTTDEIDEEYGRTADFPVKLDRFIIATTGEVDADLQGHVLNINTKGNPPEVSLWFWDNYVEWLNADPDLLFRYYENILKFRNQYTAHEHYFRMLAMAFDRPAIRTAVRMENRFGDFVQAISDLQEAMSTGVLRDRDGRTIDQVSVPKGLPKARKEIQKLLQKTRDKATEGVEAGVIREHGHHVEVPEPYASQLNQFRREAVDLLNVLLKERGIDEIDFLEY